MIGNIWIFDNLDVKYFELCWQGVYFYGWDFDVENFDFLIGKGDWIEVIGNYKIEIVNWIKYFYWVDFFWL